MNSSNGSDRAASALGTRGRTVVALIALVAALVMIGVGVVRVLPEEPADVAAGVPEASDSPSAAAVVPPNIGRERSDALVDVSGGAVKDLPAALASFDQASEFQVSPDGTRIAFTAPGGGGDPRQLFVADIDGSRLHHLTEGPSVVSSPRWSPDSRRIAYELATSERAATILIAKDSDRDPNHRTSTHVARVATSGLWHVGAGASFGPDGDTIMYTSHGGGGHLNLRMVSTDGSDDRLLIRDAAYGAFSPDGEAIAFQRMVPRSSESGDKWPSNQGVWLADADGSHPRPLFANDEGSARAPLSWKHVGPYWSGDGSQIAYLDPSDGRVYVVDVTSDDVTEVGKGGWPSWYDNDTLIVETFGGPAPQFTLADVAGNWFDVSEGNLLLLSVGHNGKYFIEDFNDGGLRTGQTGTVRVRGDDVRFLRKQGSGWCSANRWGLRDVTELASSRLSGTGTGYKCASSRPSTLSRVGAVRAGRPLDASGSARMHEADLVGVWSTGDDTVRRYRKDGTFQNFYVDADFWEGGSFDEGGRWALERGKLRLMYEGGRACVDRHGVMSDFHMFSDRRHRLELQRVEWVRPDVIALRTVKEECYDSEGEIDTQAKLFRSNASFRTVARVAPLKVPGPFGDRSHLRLLRNSFTHRTCLSDIARPNRASLCGPAEGTIAAWKDDLHGPLDFVDSGVMMGFGSESHFGWGAFDNPVQSVKVEHKVNVSWSARKKVAHKWIPARPRMYPLPGRLSSSFQVVVVWCDCDRIRVSGLDSNGQVIARVRV